MSSPEEGANAVAPAPAEATEPHYCETCGLMTNGYVMAIGEDQSVFVRHSDQKWFDYKPTAEPSG
jgi:hypothetical protein